MTHPGHVNDDLAIPGLFPILATSRPDDGTSPPVRLRNHCPIPIPVLRQLCRTGSPAPAPLRSPFQSHRHIPVQLLAAVGQEPLAPPPFGGRQGLLGAVLLVVGLQKVRGGRIRLFFVLQLVPQQDREQPADTVVDSEIEATGALLG